MSHSHDSHDHAGHQHGDGQLDPIQQRMDQLLDQGIQTALKMLQQNGEFYPFGVARTAKGDFTLVMAKTEAENPKSDELIAQLIKGLNLDAREQRITSAAVVSDVRMRDPQTQRVSDAICVQMEDMQGEPIMFFLPYVHQGPSIATSDIAAQHAPAMIFT